MANNTYGYGSAPPQPSFPDWEQDIADDGSGIDTFAGSMAYMHISLASGGNDNTASIYGATQVFTTMPSAIKSFLITNGPIENVTVTGPMYFATITGNSLDNVLLGWHLASGGFSNEDVIDGAGGNDVIFGGVGVDKLFGGSGNDYIYFDPLDDLANVLGGADFDTLIVQAGLNAAGFDLASHQFERARVDFTDTGGQAWSTANQYYQPGWVLEYTDTFYDNGTRQVQVFDTGAPDPWSSYIDYYTAGGQLEARRTINDNGTYSTTYFDLGAQSWNRYTDFNYGPASQLTARQTINDDNSYTNTFFDALHQNAWSQYTDYYNSVGAFIGRTGLWDDGSPF